MRRSDEDEAERERIENALAALARARRLLELAWGRVARTGDALSAEAFEQLEQDVREAREFVERAQRQIGEEWRAWQRARGYHERDP